METKEKKVFLHVRLNWLKGKQNKNISVDIGQVILKPTMTISSDLWKQNQAKT